MNSNTKHTYGIGDRVWFNGTWEGTVVEVRGGLLLIIQGVAGGIYHRVPAEVRPR